MLPKSLHTVRILAAVAATVAGGGNVLRVLEAARIIGYPTASTIDPLIVKAAAVLAKGAA
jgi:hypothetical protein